MRVGVIGSGAIGPDLAYGFLSALAGVSDAKVYLVDIRQDALDAGVARIEGYLNKGLARGKVSARAAEQMKANLVPTLSLSDLSECSYVLEAASEDLSIKRRILADLEAVVSDDCLIGFATSGIPRSRIASEAKVSARCFVNHPFFPAWRSLPIEIVPSEDDALTAQMFETIERLGKAAIWTKDVVCFAADDVFCNYCAEAARIVAEGVATAAQVDVIVHEAIGGGGPLNVLDQTEGNKLVEHCQELMAEVREDGQWFTPPPMRAGRGPAPWHGGGGPRDPISDALRTEVLERILAVLFARTYYVVDHGICDASDMNWMTRMALGFSDGLLDLAERHGAEEVHRICTSYAEGRPGFEIPPSIQAKALPSFWANVTVSRADDGVATLMVRRPEVRNALSSRTLSEIDAAIRELSDDDAVKGIIVTGWRGSLAGADIGELARVESAAEAEAVCHNEHAIAARIEGLSKPVVAAVDGAVLGGGAELSMTCHARVVGPSLMLGQPEVNLGIIPGYGGTQRLPRLIGVARAMDMMRTGRPIKAKQAVAWGWAHAQSDDPQAAARALIHQHLAGEVTLAPVDPAPIEVPEIAPANIGHRSLAVDAILVDVTRRGLAMPLSEGLALEAKGFGRCSELVDMDIGMKNFMQNGPRVPAEFLHE